MRTDIFPFFLSFDDDDGRRRRVKKKNRRRRKEEEEVGGPGKRSRSRAFPRPTGARSAKARRRRFFFFLRAPRDRSWVPPGPVLQRRDPSA